MPKDWATMMITINAIVVIHLASFCLSSMAFFLFRPPRLAGRLAGGLRFPFLDNSASLTNVLRFVSPSEIKPSVFTAIDTRGQPFAAPNGNLSAGALSIIAIVMAPTIGMKCGKNGRVVAIELRIKQGIRLRFPHISQAH
jgi:hypothetical protein